MKARTFFLTLVMAMCGLMAWADSPLTSTHFAKAYADVPIVTQATNASGKLNSRLLDYVSDSRNPIDVRVAVINALGWDFHGTKIGTQLRDHLFMRYHVKNEEALLKKLDAPTLVTYAYAKALSDYFNVEQAMSIAQLAVAKNKEHSFTINFIAALIKAQDIMDNGSWGDVYTTVASVLSDDMLTPDMRNEAIGQVMEYINLYAEYL